VAPTDLIPLAAGLDRLVRPNGALASDALFLRRVSLDLTGTLPSGAEAARFLADAGPGKRAGWVERLLESEEYASYWALRFGDILRIKAEFPINLWPNAAQLYHRWLRSAIASNTPWNTLAFQLLTASGSNFKAGPVNFWRAVPARDPGTLAQAVALTFLGSRLERWPEARRQGFGLFFARLGYKPTQEWKEEIVFFDPSKPYAPQALLPNGRPLALTSSMDPRVVFARWLLEPVNLLFPRALCARLWAWLFDEVPGGEADDLHEERSSPLLDYLASAFVQVGYDWRALLRMITLSQTYQQAERAPRRLDAEVLIDAICQITGTTEEYSSAVPEPFTFLPTGTRAIDLPDPSLSSPFLELFGRPARDSGLLSERNLRFTAEQRLHLLNSSHIHNKIQQSAGLRALVANPARPRDAVDNLYLAILARYPSDAELRRVQEHFRQAGNNRWPAVVDLAWALLNSSEFLYRH